MASKRNRSAGTAQPSCSRNLGYNTNPSQSDGKRKLEKSPERAKKRRRTSPSPLESISGPSSRDADSLFVTAYSDNTGHNTKPCQSDGKRKLEKSPDRAKKRRRTSQSHLESISGPSPSDADSLFVTAYSDNTGHNTNPCQSDGKRKSEKSPERAKKRRRTSQSPLESISGPSSRDADSLFVTAHIDNTVCNAGPSKPASTSTRTERKNRKRTSEETGGPSKRRKTTPSASKDPDNQAAKTAISSSSIRKLPFESREDFEARYQEEGFLGKGGFGTVFAGYRKEDNLPVAIKHIKQFLNITMNVAGEITAMPLELAILLKLSDKESSGVVKMHDWYHLKDELIIILERPDPCMDLSKYINSREVSLQEDEVKIITKQLVDAIIEVHSIGVFHRDIKPANILIETGSDVPRVRLIDFGCGTFLSGSRYTVKKGTILYQSPEWFKNGWYTAEGTNVWQLGVTVFKMLHNGCYPFSDVFEISFRDPYIRTILSTDCQDFLRSCLQKNLDDRPTMEMLKNHPWLM